MELGPFQIMPNHVHLVTVIIGVTIPKITLGNIIAYFKYQSTKQINNVGIGYSDPNNTGRGNPAPTKYPKIFQRNYYEHIIRNDKELEKISWYIMNNPEMWDRDRNNPGMIVF